MLVIIFQNKMSTLACVTKIVVSVLFVVATFGFCLVLYGVRDQSLQQLSFLHVGQNNGGLQEHCFFKINVFFLKVPKCASGTTMVLLWRFVMTHNLNPLINPNSPPKLHPRKSYNVLATHMKYDINNNAISEIMPNNTTYIAIVREPKTRFQSLLIKKNEYSKMRQEAPLNARNTTDGELLLRTIQKNPERFNYILNTQTRYFGIRADSPEADMKKVFSTFDLIMIADYYDESLVLLKRHMCWDLKDIIYTKKHVQHYSPDQKNVMLHPVIRAWFSERNYNDNVFYRKCLNEFNRKVSNEGDAFHQEVEFFQSVLRKTDLFCSSGLDQLLYFEPSRWNRSFNISTNDCKLLNLDTEWSIHFVENWQRSKPKQPRGT
ncbi:hypothetical protein ScPMuIL_014460 [Solemya velum]